MGKEIDAYLASRSYAPASEKQRRSILEAFAAAVDPVTADVDDVLLWWDTTRHLSVASRRAYLLAVSGFMDWIIRAGYRTGPNPAELIRVPTVHRQPPKVLTPDQVSDLRAALETEWEHLVIGLMLDLGLRVGEVARLEAADLDGAVLYVRGKGGKDAMLPMPDHLVALWPSGGRVFHGTPGALGERVKRIMRRADIDASAHWLRRTAATEWARRGVAPHVISSLLRHSSIATSAHYVRVDMDDLRRAVA
jgi:integrase/recombinase XerD